MPSSDEKVQQIESGTISGDEMVKFDGFYFVPDYDDYDENYKLAFFNFKEEWTMAKPIEKSEMGYKYHMHSLKKTKKVCHSLMMLLKRYFLTQLCI